jgi:hypothetical protein
MQSSSIALALATVDGIVRASHVSLLAVGGALLLRLFIDAYLRQAAGER